MKTVIEMAKEAGYFFYDLTETHGVKTVETDEDDQWAQLKRLAEIVRAEERERICKAIKEEDDYCVTEGDYMLDSDDCIAVAKGEWVRPDYIVDATKAPT